ncbi:hypothetical protein K458DRAFT_383050 [Lentithecium fluviatile CBS 122367]|uniref:Carbonic anhydrase n=1 Tax=Lentithecium fluviatile CBS 122367 TaxID=1168545 RepID=A0A6G1JH99_9PLEO|nr:hypothetical protein K458DRAFT_383050 [Lentithecium fluviatile CBS 122367]
MPSGTLVIISCSEPDPRIDPSRYINLSANGSSTSVIKTTGGRTGDAINNVYHIDQSSRIGMIVVVQHTSCAWALGDGEANIQTDLEVLRASPYVRSEIPIIGYVIDVATGTLKEVSIQHNAPDEATRREVLSKLEDFGPFWS